MHFIYRIENLNTKLKSTGRTILREMGVPIYSETSKYDNAKGKNRDRVIQGLIKDGNTKDKAEEWVDRLSIRMNSSIEQDDYDWIEYAINTIDKHADNYITKKTKENIEYQQKNTVVCFFMQKKKLF